MPGLDPGIHGFAKAEGVDGLDIQRSRASRFARP